MNHVGSSVNLHIVVDGKILLMRRISQRWMDGKLQIPGGHVDEGESPLVAVLREANEELGLTITSKDVEHLATVVVREDGSEYFALQFRLLQPERFTFQIIETEKCSELIWAHTSSLPADIIPLFKTIIEQTGSSQRYIELGY